MISVFADAVFYIALLSKRDQNHAAAKRLAQSYSGRIVTTEYVLLEAGNYLSSSKRRRLKFVELMDWLQADPNTRIVPSSHDTWTSGLAIYKQRLDKNWSLTDCISMVVMKQEGLTEALTADHHFEQAGFSILLK
ncbi:MAG: PIN domain-containing protein [Pirellulales bacterium]